MDIVTVANISTKGILSLCADHSVDTASLLSDVGINQRLIEDSNARIPIEQVCHLWIEAKELTGDNMIALHTSERLPFGSNKVFDYMMASRSTGGEAIDVLTRFHRLLNDVYEFDVRIQKDCVHIELHNNSYPLSSSKEYTEYILANVVKGLRFSTGTNLKPKEISFTHSSPKEVSEYHRIFQSNIKFNQPVNRITFERGILNLPQPNADPLLCDVLERYAHQRLKDLSEGRDFINDLCRVLRESLQGGDASVTFAAKKLAMSRRSLQRKLQAQGTSFRKILDNIQHDISVKLLKEQQATIAETAFLLGFSETSSFCRSFKRWTGKTPQEYLRMQL